ncbi:hypothetical protein [Flavobacterium sp. I3-2]|uniref:hypothetical protein n=1 Tax=Flavobacterium sp. I3-2 TaxID=2748319 RepID=UPI002107E6B7|nr:hypothetical protein [Flavobacterium sp. I3-2]
MKYLIKNIIYVFSIITTSLVLINCGGSIESVERDELISTFESNFGFSPPKSVKEIKLKNWGLYDTDVHWLAFTYDSIVLSKIISNEQNLSVVLNNS